MAVNLKVRDRNGERVIEMRQDRATFGRSSDCTVQIEDTMASREHCRIEKQGETEFKLIDLESRNGTRVNGMHVNQHKLAHGDQIQIGEVTVVFDCPSVDGGGGGGGAASSGGKPKSGPRRSTSGARKKHTTRRVVRRRGRGAGNELAIVGAVACLVISIGALAMILGGGGGESSAQKLLGRAQSELSKGNYDDAISLAEKVISNRSAEPAETETARKIKEKAESAQQLAADEERIRQADLAFKRVEADEKKGKLKGDALWTAYKQVVTLYPGTGAASQAQKRLAELKGATGTGKDPIAELRKKAERLMGQNEFQQAIDLFQAYWEKTGDKKATEEIKKINERGDRAFKDLHRRAQAALSGGQKDRAREFYQEIKRHFGGTWAQKADAELGRIK